MDLTRPLAVVTPTVDGDVLAALASADAGFTGRGLHRIIGRRSHEGVRRSLERLAAQGIVVGEPVGGATLYRLNRAHLAAPHIEAIAGVRAELLRRMRERFESWSVPAAYAALFGSAARGDMRVDSDIDVFIVRPSGVDPDGEPWKTQIGDLARDVAAWTGNDVRPLEHAEDDVRVGDAKRRGVIAEIVRDGVHLAGPSSYLRRRG